MRLKKKICLFIILFVTICVNAYAMELDGMSNIDVTNTVGNTVLNDDVVENENNNVVSNNQEVYTNNLSSQDDCDVYPSDTSGDAVSLVRIIGFAITIVQCVLVTVGIILFLFVFFRNKSPKVLLSMFGLMSFAGAFILNIIKNFAHKPIIYIYPEEEIEVEVKVSNPEKFTCTYPKYKDSWKVLAKPTGDLVDIETGKKLYSLYWEGLNTTKPNYKEGFIVKGEEVATFLEEKLEILGLNEREKEEFIIYWLPLMEKNRYNYVRFETIDEIKENMDLIINPKPDTLIRINMEFKPLLFPIDVEIQKLEKVERKGYTVVEWGGTKL